MNNNRKEIRKERQLNYILSSSHANHHNHFVQHPPTNPIPNTDHIHDTTQRKLHDTTERKQSPYYNQHKNGSSHKTPRVQSLPLHNNCSTYNKYTANAPPRHIEIRTYTRTVQLHTRSAHRTHYCNTYKQGFCGNHTSDRKCTPTEFHHLVTLTRYTPGLPFRWDCVTSNWTGS